MQPFYLNTLFMNMEKKIIITNKQRKHLFENVTNKPSAQDQVKNKVNAGVMDCVVCNGIMESSENDFDFNSSINSILKFIREQNPNVFPYPTVELNWEDQNGLFISTGYYQPSLKKVVLFCKNRHPKDILRSFTHEIYHHIQNLEGKNMNFSNEDDVKDNNELEKLEGEAYLNGNLYFRKWTEYERKKNDVLQENKNVTIKSELYKYRIKETIKENIKNNIQFNGDYKSILEEAIGKDSFDNYIPYCDMIDNFYKQLSEGYTIYAPIVDESIKPEDVDLSSFNIQKDLNPKFWKDGKLDSRIRIKLLDIADDFFDFIDINWVKPEDIIITGSLANFNWNKKYSDIDLHIIIDYKKIDKRIDFVENYLHAQKKIWNEEHKDIKIFGFPVEIYTQDVNEKHISNGVYSLEKNEWITKPERNKIAKVKVNKTIIKNKVSEFSNKIDNLLDTFNKIKTDNHKLEKLLKKSEILFDNIKSLRREDLKNKNNEITEGNIIFKSLRRLNYIEKLSNLITLIYDKMNSLP